MDTQVQCQVELDLQADLQVVQVDQVDQVDQVERQVECQVACQVAMPRRHST